MSRPTITDVANSANVSVATVNRVLNGSQMVKKSTAQQVLQAAERINFHGVGTLRYQVGPELPKRKFGYLLLQKHRSFYKRLSNSLINATNHHHTVDATSIIEFMEDLSPSYIAEQITKLGRRCDAIAVVAPDQPEVNEAIAELEFIGKPVFAMVSDLTASHRAGYVGLDNWKTGRTAAWFIENICSRSGKVATYVGSHRYLSQDVSEASFRTYLREKSSQFQVLPTIKTMEESDIAYKKTLELISNHKDLVGIYVAGGGIKGVAAALEQANFKHKQKPVVIALDITEDTRAGLVSGIIDIVLALPMEQLALNLIAAMVDSTTTTSTFTKVHNNIIPLNIITAQNM